MQKYFVTACSRQGVRNVLSKMKSSTIVISIRDPDKEKIFKEDEPIPHVCAILQLPFWDEIDDEYGCISEMQAEEIAHFVRTHIPFVSNIVVNCEGGISRSAGVAAAISKYFNGEDNQFFDYFHYRYVPNTTCHKRVLEALYNSEQRESELQ